MILIVEILHNISVQDMGNYQEYLKKMAAPLRELETMPVRQHTFGNPFKVNKVCPQSSIHSIVSVIYYAWGRTRRFSEDAS